MNSEASRDKPKAAAGQCPPDKARGPAAGAGSQGAWQGWFGGSDSGCQSRCHVGTQHLGAQAQSKSKLWTRDLGLGVLVFPDGGDHTFLVTKSCEEPGREPCVPAPWAVMRASRRPHGRMSPGGSAEPWKWLLTRGRPWDVLWWRAAREGEALAPLKSCGEEKNLESRKPAQSPRGRSERLGPEPSGGRQGSAVPFLPPSDTGACRWPHAAEDCVVTVAASARSAHYAPRTQTTGQVTRACASGFHSMRPRAPAMG